MAEESGGTTTQTDGEPEVGSASISQALRDARASRAGGQAPPAADVATAGAEGVEGAEGSGTDDGVVEPVAASASELARVRAEAARYRTQLREVTTERDKLRSATQTDQERLETRVTTAEARVTDLESTNRSLSIQLAALKAGALDPADLVGLVGADVEDFDKSIAQLRKKYPGMFGVVSPGGGSVNGGAGAGSSSQFGMNDLIRRASGRF